MARDSPYRRFPHSSGGVILGSSRQCFACGDTGILLNHDRAINLYPGMDDYDDIVGLDVPLICNCNAAYPDRDPSGQVIRSGFRQEGGAIVPIDSGQGPRTFGAEPPEGLIHWLVDHRARAWKAFAAMPHDQRDQMLKQNLDLLRESIAAVGSWSRPPANSPPPPAP